MSLYASQAAVGLPQLLVDPAMTVPFVTTASFRLASSSYTGARASAAADALADRKTQYSPPRKNAATARDGITSRHVGHLIRQSAMIWSAPQILLKTSALPERPRSSSSRSRRTYPTTALLPCLSTCSGGLWW